MLVILWEDLLFVCATFGTASALSYLTVIAELLTLIHVQLSFILEFFGEDAQKWSVLLRVNHVVFEVLPTLNTMVVSIYWSVLHEEVLNSVDYKGNQNRTFHLYVVHSLPFIFMIVHFCLTNIVVLKTHVFFLWPVCVGYTYINYTATL